jgi:hypothetical protein
MIIDYIFATIYYRFSALYDERVEIYRQEKKKTEKLLTDLLPRQIIRQMKKGEVPQPETFESVSVFLCDIVGFTTLSSESTAHQIVDMLNLLYNMYDSRIDAYDVYKVKFRFSKKATNVLQNFPYSFDVTKTYVRSKWKIFSNFVAFSQYVNFNKFFI